MNCTEMNCTEDEIRFVSSIASRFCGRGIEFCELVQEGYVGLLKAKKTFDVQKNSSFFGYAFAFVQGEMRRAIRENNVIRLPRNTYAVMKRIREEIEFISSESGEDTTVNDVANKLGINAELVINAMNAADKTASIQNFKSSIRKEEQDGEENIEEQVVNRVFISELMSHLNEVEQQVVQLRYFYDYTQEKTAMIMNLSQTLISKLEKNALKKMRRATDFSLNEK